MEKGLETEKAPGTRVRGPPGLLPAEVPRVSQTTWQEDRQSHGGTHAEAQLPGIAAVVSFAFLAETEKRG